MTDSNVQPSVVRIFEDIFNGTQVKNADWIQQHQCRISSSSFGLLVKRSKAVEKAEREVKVTTRELMAMRKAIKPTSGKTGKKLQPQQKEVDRVEKRDEQKQKQLARTTQSLQRTPQQIRDSFDPSRPTPQNCQYGKCFEPYAVAAYLQWKGAAVVACHRSGMCVPTFCPQLSACPDRWLKFASGEYRPLEIKVVTEPRVPVPHTIRELIKARGSSWYLRLDDEDDEIHMSHDHPYYYQCQGQMLCSGAKKCEFFAYHPRTYETVSFTFGADKVMQRDIVARALAMQRDYDGGGQQLDDDATGPGCKTIKQILDELGEQKTDLNCV